MAKSDSSDQVLNTPVDQIPAPKDEVVAVDGVPVEQLQSNQANPEDVKVTKADHKVVSSIGLAPGGLGHRLVEPGEVVKYDEFGADDNERKTVIARLISLGAIEPVKDEK